MKRNDASGSGRFRSKARTLMIPAAVAVALLTVAGIGSSASAGAGRTHGVYAMTNAAGENEVVAYRRAANGRLAPIGSFGTGGEGTGRTRLSSQNPVILNERSTRLYVVNVRSDEITVFDVHRDATLSRLQVIASGGEAPYSLALSPDGDRLHVLNNGLRGAGNITGFAVAPDGQLSPIADGTRPLSGEGTDPAQVSYTPDGRRLVVTEKATNTILTYEVGDAGVVSGPTVHDSAGDTPFGFAFTRDGVAVVTEAFDEVPGEAAASSYSLNGPAALETISGSVPNGQAEVCWAVITPTDRFAYVTNFGNGTISTYLIAADGRLRVHDPVSATTTLAELSVRDLDLTADGRFMYAIDINSRRVHAWRVRENGLLVDIGAFAGLPRTVAGMAAS